jgi:hypothetical protein
VFIKKLSETFRKLQKPSEVFLILSRRSTERRKETTDEGGFNRRQLREQSGEVGPPLLSFRMCCLHAHECKTGRGTFLGPGEKIFEF